MKMPARSGMLISLACAPTLAAEGNDLFTSMANIFEVAPVKSRSISPENFTGEKGKGGMATEGTGKNASRELGQGVESIAVGGHRRQEHLHAGGNHRAGSDSTNLGDARGQLEAQHLALLLG